MFVNPPELIGIIVVPLTVVFETHTLYDDTGKSTDTVYDP